MNTTLHDLLVTWGFCSLITIIGFWLSSRLPFPNLGCEKKNETQTVYFRRRRRAINGHVYIYLRYYLRIHMGCLFLG
jgi:hypothetical protein